MTFGSAVTAEDVPAYLASVRHGRPADAELLDEFRRRYSLIGRSPLVEITLAQAQALQSALDEDFGAGRYSVAVGMLHSAPTIAAGMAELATAGVDEVIGLILAPQYSDIIMGGYRRAFSAATTAAGLTSTRLVREWHDVPELITSLAERVRAALDEMSPSVPVVFTAHSLPRAVVDRDPAYLAQIQQTVTAVADASGLPSERWQFAYQSAGHTPEEWLTPDFTDLMPSLRAAGHDEVLVVPTQFLADHLEVLYDIDIAGQAEAAQAGLSFRRIAMPNTCPLLIRALVGAVRRAGVG